MTTATTTTDTPRTDAYQYADYILNHYDRNSHKDKLSLAKSLIENGYGSKAEVERLKDNLASAIEIADKYRERISCVINEDCDWSMHDTHREFNEIKGTLNQDKK